MQRPLIYIENIVNSMPAQHIFTKEVKQVVIMMSQTQIKFLMLLNEKAYLLLTMTHTTSTWFSDVDTKLLYYNYGKVHAGISSTVYWSLWNYIRTRSYTVY